MNRQAQRSIKALQGALIELLEEQPYQKISITDLADRSGLTRSTFYSHFETKDQLLESIIYDVINSYFEALEKLDIHITTSDEAIESRKIFFQAWKDNKHLIPLLDSVDFDCLLIRRLKSSWEEYFEASTRPKVPKVSAEYDAYGLNFLSYAYVGFLKEWIRQDMQTPVETIAEMLEHFTSLDLMMAGRKKFKGRI